MLALATVPCDLLPIFLLCFIVSAQPAKFLDSLPSQPHLDDGVDGEGQESLGLVEDVENREGHEGFLEGPWRSPGHQSMHSKHDQCHLGETQVVTVSC